MAKGKVKATMIKLVSTAGTGFFYTARKNPSSIQHKLGFRKYDPIPRCARGGSVSSCASVRALGVHGRRSRLSAQSNPSPCRWRPMRVIAACR
ncbi:hypothetical protein FNF27_02784 [Cafeteria roenbergensis]|uniref:Ribosomal protein L33 n=1 Tax=Cafeteria roenbergensis TaxID=33653 RepID=A0A5A8DZK2_CAFRO|nr:hypothetical protein FNF31_05855 [Cafeteria roenbergensis]KAA0170926.1 hypothetical protein FNF28_01201 [Cafeteria roenbergensis]KAA0175700.1 hypothetical protein FNF27_02784 [Cafeteria roenbergensis]